MAYFKDVREHLTALDAAGLLVRVDRKINKDTELNPLVPYRSPLRASMPRRIPRAASGSRKGGWLRRTELEPST